MKLRKLIDNNKNISSRKSQHNEESQLISMKIRKMLRIEMIWPGQQNHEGPPSGGKDNGAIEFQPNRDREIILLIKSDAAAKTESAVAKRKKNSFLTWTVCGFNCRNEAPSCERIQFRFPRIVHSVSEIFEAIPARTDRDSLIFLSLSDGFLIQSYRADFSPNSR
jgi:hypothetical protein